MPKIQFDVSIASGVGDELPDKWMQIYPELFNKSKLLLYTAFNDLSIPVGFHRIIFQIENVNIKIIFRSMNSTISK